MTGLDKNKKGELTKNISAGFLKKYNQRVSKLADKSAVNFNMVALEELEKIVKEMIGVVNKTLSEDAKKKFSKDVNLLLSKSLGSA